MEAMERRLFLDASQLTVTMDAGTLPAEVSDHAALKGKMSITVSNQSGVNQSARVVVGFLIAVGPLDVVNRNYGVLKSMTTPLSLADGKSKTFKFTINIGAGKIFDGVYTIYAIVVDPTNAFAQFTGPTLTVRPPIVTLSETENILKLPDSTATGAKVSVKDQVSITNSGVDPSTEALTIGIYATPDGIPAHGSLMTFVTRKVTIKPGKTVLVSVTIGGIPALAIGTYKLVTQVTQADGTITTTDPATAPIVTVTQPTSGVHFNPTINTDTPEYAPEPLNGAMEYLSFLTMEMQIKNTGTGAAGEDQFNLYASSSPTFDSSAVQIGGPLSLDLGSIPHNGLRIFNIEFGATADLNDFSGSEVDRYIFVQVTDPTGNTSIASLGKTLKVAGLIG
jgi:hypothetical protein